MCPGPPPAPTPSTEVTARPFGCWQTGLRSRESCSREGKGAGSPAWHGLPSQQLWDFQRPRDLLCSPTQGLAHWCGAPKESLRGGRGRCGGSGAQQGGPGAISVLMLWAQDPASPRKTASQQELPSFKYGSFSFSPSPALARVRSLSLFLSPPLPPLLVPLIPSVACVVLALGVAWQHQGRVGGFPPLSGKRRSAEHCVPGGVCSRVRARARKGSKQLRPRAVALSLPPSLPSSLVRSPTSLRSLSLIHPAEGLAHSLLLC